MLVVVSLRGNKLGPETIWIDARVPEPRGGSLIVKGTAVVLAAVTLSPEQKWVGEGLDEEAFRHAVFLFLDIVLQEEGFIARKS